MAISQDFEEILDTEAGVRVLRHIAKLCGARSPVTSVAGGEAKPYGTMYNDGRKSVWLNICEALTPQQIFTCEFAPPTPNDKIGEPEEDVRPRTTSKPSSKQYRGSRKQ